MRLKGNEFANIFSHFAPIEWKGPRYDRPSTHESGIRSRHPSCLLPCAMVSVVFSEGNWHPYGYAKGRCSTLADEGNQGCTLLPKHQEHEVDLLFGAAKVPVAEFMAGRSIHDEF